jgi:hypothetical protein
MKWINILLCVFSVAILLVLSGCQGSLISQMYAASYPTEPRNYKPAGFNSRDEIRAYADYYQYLAFKIPSEDWEMFYRRFPEYWRDIQLSKSIAFAEDYSPGYTAYAFKWNIDCKQKGWDDPTLKRLRAKILSPGDDAYKIIFALGMPPVIIWDNDFDILLYDDGSAVLLKDNKFNSSMSCTKCTEYPLTNGVKGDNRYKSSDKILKILNLKRDAY